MPSQMASSTDHGSLVVSSNLTSTMKTLFKEKCISSCQESDKSLPGSPENVKNLGVGTYSPIRRPRIPRFKGGESVIRLSLGTLLVNLLPVAQWTNVLTPRCPGRLFTCGVPCCPACAFRVFGCHSVFSPADYTSYRISRHTMGWRRIHRVNSERKICLLFPLRVGE